MKSATAHADMQGVESHPTGVRGLKFADRFHVRRRLMSHPTGVRGLK